MDIIASLKANSQTPKLMEPTVSAFHNPAEDTQAAAMFGIAFCQHGYNTQPPQAFTVRLRVVSTVALNTLRPASGTSAFALHRRNGIYQRHQLRTVVCIGTSQRGCQGDAVSIRDDMVLRAEFAAICGVWASFCPPKTARMDVLSTTARDQSISSAACRCSSRTRWILSHTPSCCQRFNRRQQDIPDPHPISCGRYSQGMPVFNTNRIPVRTSRWDNGLRPGYRRRRRFGGGNNGSINFHSSSSKIGFPMVVPPCTDRDFSKHR